MKKYFLALFVCMLMAAMACEVSNDSNSSDKDNSAALETSTRYGWFKFGRKIASYRWNTGWTTVEPFYTSAGHFLFILKENRSGRNVKVLKINSNGTIGDRIASYTWSTGWEKARFYRIYGESYMFIYKYNGLAKVMKINSDGTIRSSAIQTLHWDSNWSTIEFYNTYPVNRQTEPRKFLFLMKEHGGDVRILRIYDNGTINTSAVQEKSWSSGWTNAVFFNDVSNLDTRMIIYKRNGGGNDGCNVHYHTINQSTGKLNGHDPEKSGNLPSGLEILKSCLHVYGNQGGGGHYYNLFTLDTHLSDIGYYYRMSYNGGDVATIGQGWTDASYYRLGDNKEFMIISRSAGYMDGKNVLIYKINEY